ncbi:class I SAM-dependent methyltransferase [Haloferacaceae archaeon DSL9]
MRDFQRGGLRGDCRIVDGDDTADAGIEAHYFTPPTEWRPQTRELLASLSGPVLDVGCGAGRHARWLQRRTEVVAVDVSPAAARESGVEDARVAAMFDLSFEADRFGGVLVNGTQIGLARSVAGVRAFLDDLARLTTADAMALVDNYDPSDPACRSLLGYRSDPRPEFAHRGFHVEYHRETPNGGGSTVREVGRTLWFLLCSPERLAEIADETPWRVDSVHRGGENGYYRAVLEKRVVGGTSQRS